MISLELFKKIMLDIEKQEEVDQKLTELLVCKDCTGWVSTAEDIIQDLYKLLQITLGDKYEMIEWWLYDISDGHKFVYESINDTTECVMDLNDLDNLYYYITGDHENVTQFTQPKQERETFTQNCSMDDVMDTIFGEQIELGMGKKPDISNIQL